MQLGVAGPRVGAVEVVAQQPQEERERLRSCGPACEGARHPPKNITHQGSEGGGRGVVRRDGTRVGFLEGALPTGDPVGGTKAIMAVIVAHHDNIRRGGLDRTSELQHGVARSGFRPSPPQHVRKEDSREVAYRPHDSRGRRGLRAHRLEG